MALTINQILVIGLILVLIAFVIVFARMGVSALDLMKEIKKLVGAGNDFVDNTKETVQKVEDKIVDTANQLVEEADTATKVVTVAAGGIIGFSLISAILKRLFGSKSKRAKKMLKASEKELKEAKKAAKRARKIQRKAGKVARIGF